MTPFPPRAGSAGLALIAVLLAVAVQSWRLWMGDLDWEACFLETAPRVSEMSLTERLAAADWIQLPLIVFCLALPWLAWSSIIVFRRHRLDRIILLLVLIGALGYFTVSLTGPVDSHHDCDREGSFASYLSFYALFMTRSRSSPPLHLPDCCLWSAPHPGLSGLGAAPRPSPAPPARRRPF